MPTIPFNWKSVFVEFFDHCQNSDEKWAILCSFFMKSLKHQQLIYSMFENVKRIILSDDTITYFFESNYILSLNYPLPDALWKFLLLHVRVLQIDSMLSGTLSQQFLKMAGKFNCFEEFVLFRTVSTTNTKDELKLITNVIDRAVPKGGICSIVAWSDIVHFNTRYFERARIYLDQFPTDAREFLAKKTFAVNELILESSDFITSTDIEVLHKPNQINGMFEGSRLKCRLTTKLELIVTNFAFDKDFHIDRLLFDIKRIFPQLERVKIELKFKCEFQQRKQIPIAGVMIQKEMRMMNGFEIHVVMKPVIIFNGRDFSEDFVKRAFLEIVAVEDYTFGNINENIEEYHGKFSRYVSKPSDPDEKIFSFDMVIKHATPQVNGANMLYF
uniref:Maturase K n=1 Tax=Panagrolaimus sp. JU765 TaxID=591449 RepID=A0AC34QMM8_9BILA